MSSFALVSQGGEFESCSGSNHSSAVQRYDHQFSYIHFYMLRLVYCSKLMIRHTFTFKCYQYLYKATSQFTVVK